MRKTTFIKSLLLIVALLVGNAVRGASGDVIYTLDCGTGHPFGTSNAYALKSGTHVNQSISIDWTVTLGSAQNANAFWVGSNSNNKAKLTLGATYQALGVPNSISATDTYVSAIIAGSNLENIGKITISNLEIKGGATNPEVYIVHSVDNGTSYVSTTTQQTAASAGTLTFDFATIANARYAIIIKGSNDFTFRVPIIKFYEGVTSAPTQVVQPQISASGAEKATDDFYNSAMISLSTITEGASIYYTTNGDVPTISSSAYSAAFEITSTTTIKALAVKAGLDNSEVAEKTIIISTISTPTITVTELEVPEMIAVVGLEDSETVNVSGMALTADIIVSIAGADAAMFSVSPSSIAQADGIAAGTVTVTYSPTAPGTHLATLKFNSTDATEQTLALSGISTLATAVALDATNINTTKFSANWEAVTGATEYELNVYTKESGAGASASDLFISEYGEGSSNNKYIEIFNGTGAAVDLANYTLKQANNGGGWDKDITYTLPLTGSLANNDVYVIAISNADATILAEADLAIAYSNTEQGGRVVAFNGNDAMGLFKNDVLIDVFGDPSSDATIAVAGFATYGQDHTIVRKPTINSGNTDWTVSAGTNETDSEWIGYEIDTWTFVGSHTMEGGSTTSPIAGSPFTVTGDTQKEITGLNPVTTYYYTVIAKSGTIETVKSNEVTVTTMAATGLSEITQTLKIRTVNGHILFDTEAGQTLQVFNSLGQKLFQGTSSEGLNSIAINTKGVLLLKIDNAVVKLILR